MKKTILTILITAIICIVGTASAAYVYTARDINYQPSDENWSVDNVQEAISELKTDVNTISNKVEGVERIYKAGETELVALVADDSFYTDSNGKYVLSNSNTGRSLLADTETYKSLPSTDDCVGIFEGDTVSVISGEKPYKFQFNFGSTGGAYDGGHGKPPLAVQTLTVNKGTYYIKKIYDATYYTLIVKKNDNTIINSKDATSYIVEVESDNTSLVFSCTSSAYMGGSATVIFSNYPID